MHAQCATDDVKVERTLDGVLKLGVQARPRRIAPEAERLKYRISIVFHVENDKTDTLEELIFSGAENIRKFGLSQPCMSKTKAADNLRLHLRVQRTQQ